MCISLVHNFKAKVGSIEDVSPGIYNMTLSLDGLVKIEAIQVERHGANA